MPEVDGILGTGSYTEIVSAIDDLLAQQQVVDFGSIDEPEQETGRIVTTPEHYAFLKIAEAHRRSTPHIRSAGTAAPPLRNRGVALDSGALRLS